jgi:hypothetical protein
MTPLPTPTEEQQEERGRGVAEGHCECGERCSCPPGSEARAKCSCWQPGEQKPIKVYGLIAFEKTQKPLIEKHCFGDCGKVSMAGAINDELCGPLWVCCEEACPWLLKQMDEPYGTTMSFGQPHEVFLRTLTDTPAGVGGLDGDH